MHVTDLLAPLATRWNRRIREELDVVPHPLESTRQTIAGRDPDRVLVLGSGPALGFGVRTQELALPGQLARRLAAVTRRGLVIDVVARRSTTAANTLHLLEGIRTELHDAVVLCVGTIDAYNLLPEDRWRSDLAELLDALRATTTPSTVIAVLPIRPMHRPNAARGRAVGVVDRHARRLDSIAEEVCSRRPGVTHLSGVVSPPEPPRTAAGYDALAQALAPWLAPELDRLAAHPATGGARTLRSKPDPEPDRQSALDRSRLVEAGSNPRLDRLLRTARDLFGISGAAVTLVDGERVVHKAAIGMSSADMPRSIAPCDRTIRQNGAFVVGDLIGEPIARDGWRFYAGHPLESPDGYRIGALCLLDTSPRQPLTVDRVALAELAGRIEAELWAEVQRPNGQQHPYGVATRESADDVVARLAAR